jgi:hypothetical protein
MNNYISKLNIVAAEYFAVAGVARHVCVTCGPKPITSTGFYYTPAIIAVGASGSSCPKGVTASFDLPNSPTGTCDYVACFIASGVANVQRWQSNCSSSVGRIPDSPPILESPVQSGSRPR